MYTRVTINSLTYPINCEGMDLIEQTIYILLNFLFSCVADVHCELFKFPERRYGEPLRYRQQDS